MTQRFTDVFRQFSERRLVFQKGAPEKLPEHLQDIQGHLDALTPAIAETDDGTLKKSREEILANLRIAVRDKVNKESIDKRKILTKEIQGMLHKEKDQHNSEEVDQVLDQIVQELEGGQVKDALPPQPVAYVSDVLKEEEIKAEKEKRGRFGMVFDFFQNPMIASVVAQVAHFLGTAKDSVLKFFGVQRAGEYANMANNFYRDFFAEAHLRSALPAFVESVWQRILKTGGKPLEKEKKPPVRLLRGSNDETAMKELFKEAMGKNDMLLDHAQSKVTQLLEASKKTIMGNYEAKKTTDISLSALVGNKIL